MITKVFIFTVIKFTKNLLIINIVLNLMTHSPRKFILVCALIFHFPSILFIMLHDLTILFISLTKCDWGNSKEIRIVLSSILLIYLECQKCKTNRLLKKFDARKTPHLCFPDQIIQNHNTCWLQDMDNLINARQKIFAWQRAKTMRLKEKWMNSKRKITKKYKLPS